MCNSFQHLLDSRWKHGVETAVDVTLGGRDRERFADHAVSVAQRVVYLVTDERPGELSSCPSVCRPSMARSDFDVVEAWIVLAVWMVEVWMVAVAGGSLAGLATAYAVGHRLDEQGTERRARSRRSSPRPRRAAPRLRPWTPVASGRCAPDGSAHTGQTKVEPGTRAGSWLTVWIGRRGRLVSMPLTP